MFDWLGMGPHGFFVGLAYSVGLGSTVLAIVISVWQRKRRIAQLKQQFRRDALQQKNAESKTSESSVS